MSGFSVVSTPPAFVNSSFPYEAVFGLANPYPARPLPNSAMLFIPVATLYAHSYNSARVVLNGQDLGGIGSHPWTDHSVINLEIETFVFSVELLSASVPLGPSIDILQITPEPGDALLVGNVWAQTI